MSVTRSTSTGWVQEVRGVTRSTSNGWFQARDVVVVPPVAVEVRRRGAGADHHARLLREDEDILAVIMAYMETRH